jgi:hypothetical protein
MGALSAVREFGDSPALDDLAVVIGNAKDDEVSAARNTVILGKCARKLARLGVFAKGCPPMGEDIIQAICRASSSDADIIIAALNHDRNRRWDETEHLLIR